MAEFKLEVSATEPKLEAAAQLLAQQLDLPLAPLNSAHQQVVLTTTRVEIRAEGLGNAIFVDFTAGKNAHRRLYGGGKGQPLARAVGLNKGSPPLILDATAGFGRDAFVFASLGSEVILVEQNPVISALLNDALLRAKAHEQTQLITNKMSVHHANSLFFLQQLQEDKNLPDVIYLDPMYPTRDKKASVKKEMQLLHQLIGPDTASDLLLDVARQKAKKRVVVKRPKSAAHIADKKPAAIINSKNTRYDLYF